MLAELTYIVSFISLMFTTWLGLYLILHNPRQLAAWLTAGVSWSVGGIFLNVALAIHPPPVPTGLPEWLLALLPFWSVGFLEKGAAGWLQGWSVAPAIVLWYHVTTLIRPGQMNIWRKSRVVAGYVVAGSAIYFQLYTSELLYADVNGSPLYLNTLQGGRLYPLYGGALVLFTGLCLYNLVRTARSATAIIPRKQLYSLTAATLAAGLAGPVSVIGSGLGLPIPMVAIELPVIAAIALIGYSVARYSALVEGRTVRQEMLYSLVGIGGIALIYLQTMQALRLMVGFPRMFEIVVGLLAVVTHSLYKAGDDYIDQLFFRRNMRELRRELRRLSWASDPEGFRGTLAGALESLGESLLASYGVLFVMENGDGLQKVGYRWTAKTLDITANLLNADDVTRLDAGLPHAPELSDAALLVPLYSAERQIGAIVFGPPKNGGAYLDRDIEWLLYPADQIAEAIWRYAEEKKRLESIRAAAPSTPPRPDASVSVEAVEEAFRSFKDYAALGDSQLARLALVQQRLGSAPATHIERGKAVQAVLQEALEKLRPGEHPPARHAPREWYPYLVLRDAYLVGVPNREIMSSLYISEGTFNRTRRGALRAVARVLEEMEPK